MTDKKTPEPKAPRVLKHPLDLIGIPPEKQGTFHAVLALSSHPETTNLMNEELTDEERARALPPSLLASRHPECGNTYAVARDLVDKRYAARQEQRASTGRHPGS